ncbi:hypothetical protein KP509_25G065200 [Ceratopteris richardii]|nr:hypothetical protein KP509_25G065200 [Ceratopteris richardii]
MTEEHGKDNLVLQAEAYLERLGKKTLGDILTTLKSCEKLLPLAEDLNIISGCVDYAAVKATSQQTVSNQEGLFSFPKDHNDSRKIQIEQWMKDLSALRIDIYERVLAGMRLRGLKTEAFAIALMYYAHQSLKGLTTKKAEFSDPSIQTVMDVRSATDMEREQRKILERIVNLLPRENGVVSISFLIGLLRAAYILGTSTECRADLEKRIGSQLHRANMDDLLIPSLITNKNAEVTLFDVDIVRRLFISFLEQKDEYDFHQCTSLGDANDGLNSPSQHPISKVCILLDAYLMEVASDPRLTLAKFMDLAELLPSYARPVEDNLYKACDTFLKTHSSLTDIDRKRLCRLLDFRKISQEVSLHAAQNERLPMQAVVQLLFIEQLRIRNAIQSGESLGHQYTDMLLDDQNLSLVSSCATGTVCRVNGALTTLYHKDDYASIRRENRELKLEVTRMKMRLSDLEKEHQNMRKAMEKGSSYIAHHQDHGFLRAFSRTMNKLNPFHHPRVSNPAGHHRSLHQHSSNSQPEPQIRAQSASSNSSRSSKNNRHSIS